MQLLVAVEEKSLDLWVGGPQGYVPYLWVCEEEVWEQCEGGEPPPGRASICTLTLGLAGLGGRSVSLKGKVVFQFSNPLSSLILLKN